MTNKGKMIEVIYAACLTKRATLVIFYLINRANQELTCFPSVGTIARECNMSTRTVQRALNDLEETDFLERERRYHDRGGQKSNMFHISSKVIMSDDIEMVDFKNNFELEQKEEKEVVADKEKIFEIESTTKDNELISRNGVFSLIEKLKKYYFGILSWGACQKFTP